jgi:hypothetical protein
MPKIPPDQCSPFGSTPANPADDVYLSTRQVCARYGDVSQMSLWRWLHDPKMKFPEPMRIQKRRYWLLADLANWERSRASKAA